MLTFKGEDAVTPVTLQLAAQPLRQWLAIVYEQTRRGDWPAWMEADASAQAAPGSATVLH